MSKQPAKRCRVEVYRKDTYRRTGRGPTGFEMHYRRGQCIRRAVANGRCKQHQAEYFHEYEYAHDEFET